MRKSILATVGFLISLGAFAPFPGRWSEAVASAVPVAPWEISYADGNGNGFHFWQEAETAAARFETTPVKPEESSSGVYSGGDAKSGPLSEKATEELWVSVRRLEGDKLLHVGSRMMGTGAFSVKEAGGAREFIVKDSPPLRDFNKFLEQLPVAIVAVKAVSKVLPIFPGAIQTPGQGGATSIQSGKNFRLSVYSSASPLTEVLRFYQTQLKKYQQHDAPDGSVKLTTDAGSVQLTKSGPQTRIQIVQGPE